MQEIRNSIANALELCLSCITPSNWTHFQPIFMIHVYISQDLKRTHCHHSLPHSFPASSLVNQQIPLPWAHLGGVVPIHRTRSQLDWLGVHVTWSEFGQSSELRPATGNSIVPLSPVRVYSQQGALWWHRELKGQGIMIDPQGNVEWDRGQYRWPRCELRQMTVSLSATWIETDDSIAVHNVDWSRWQYCCPQCELRQMTVSLSTM